MAEGGLCFDELGRVQVLRRGLCLAQFRPGGDLVGCRQALLRGQWLGHLRVVSALMDLVTSRRALLRRAWLVARELCFGLDRPQAGSASKGLFCRRFTELGWWRECSDLRGPFAEFLRSTKRLPSNLAQEFCMREFVAAFIATELWY